MHIIVCKHRVLTLTQGDRDGMNAVREEASFVLAQVLLISADVTFSVCLVGNGRQSGHGHLSGHTDAPVLN